jgi:hypothetical protein
MTFISCNSSVAGPATITFLGHLLCLKYILVMEKQQGTKQTKKSCPDQKEGRRKWTQYSCARRYDIRRKIKRERKKVPEVRVSGGRCAV